MTKARDVLDIISEQNQTHIPLEKIYGCGIKSLGKYIDKEKYYVVYRGSHMEIFHDKEKFKNTLQRNNISTDRINSIIKELEAKG